MFPQVHAVVGLPSSLPWLDHTTSGGISILVSVAVALLVWRLWRFTILPILRPREPRELPYWIPFIGHAPSFFKDADKTLTYGRLYFGNIREPWSLTVAGNQIYIMTSASDVSAVFKNIEQLTFDDYIEDMMLHFGASKAAVHTMFAAPEKADQTPTGLQPNPLHKSLIHLSESFYRQQLHPGKKLDILQDTFLGNIHNSLGWDSLPAKAIMSSRAEDRTGSLLAWTREVLLDGATRAFFGDRLVELEPKLFESFFYFDDNSWKLTYRIPRPWSNDMYAAKQTAQDAMEAYFKLPKEQRPGATWLVQTLETEMKARGIGESDIAALLMMIFWVINGNAYKLCFWVLTYILHDSSLFTAIRGEAISAVRSSTSPNDLANSLEQCKSINAVFHETLRMTSSSMSVRNVLEPVTIGGKYLRAGTKVLVPYRQLHFDDKVFGTNAAVFDPERFLASKDLSRSSSFRPFGGGTSYCPGRFIAKREVLTFVALVLERFDVDLAEQNIHSKALFPQIEDGKPCLGIMGPRDGWDTLLRVKPGSKSQ